MKPIRGSAKGRHKVTWMWRSKAATVMPAHICCEECGQESGHFPVSGRDSGIESNSEYGSDGGDYQDERCSRDEHQTAETGSCIAAARKGLGASRRDSGGKDADSIGSYAQSDRRRLVVWACVPQTVVCMADANRRREASSGMPTCARHTVSGRLAVARRMRCHVTVRRRRYSADGTRSQAMRWWPCFG
eukprot:6212743-Pleurochrysis_carterae.AAC.5